MKRPRWWLVVAGLCVAALSAAEPGTSLFVERMEYWMRDGGEWRCPNPDYQPGTEQPREYGYRFQWALHQRAVTLEIFGEFDGGRGRVTFWHNLAAWHPGEKRIVMTHLGVGGAILYGHEEMPDPDSREHVFRGVAPDGSEYRFRDIAKITGPDTHESVSFRWQDGGWVEQRKLVWQRVRPAAAPPS